MATDANIYKLVGPVLLKQDKNEAVMAVDGRLEFIEKEMYVFILSKNRPSVWEAYDLQQADRETNWRHSGEEREEENGGHAASDQDATVSTACGLSDWIYYHCLR